MNKYISLLKYEIKTIFKDTMNLFLVFYPLMMLVILGWIIPLGINEEMSDQGLTITLMIALGVSFSIGGYISGALLGFALIENKDENTLINIAVTPITVKGYTMFKILYIYILGIIGNIVIVGGLKLIASNSYVLTDSTRLLDNISWIHVVVFALINSLFAPTVAAFMGTFAKNKIEAFAFVKGGGFIVMLPMLVMIPNFTGYKQYIFGILPNFWPLKAMMNISINSQDAANLNYYVYMIIGCIYFILIGTLSVKMFIKRIK